MIFNIVRPKLEEKFTSSLKYTISIIPGQESDTATLKVPILGDQNTSLEEVCHWIQSFEDVMELKGVSDNPQALFTNVKLLLSGEARIDFQEAKKEILGDDNPTITRFRNVMNEWKRRRGFKLGQADRVREYLYTIRQPDDMDINTFASRINEINSYLPIILPPNNVRIPKDEITAIIKRCNPVYYDKLIENSVLSQDLDARQIVEYYSNLEDLHRKHNQRQTQTSLKKSNIKTHDSTSTQSNLNTSRKSPISQHRPAEARLSTDTDETYCKYHKTHSHGWNRCRKNTTTQNTSTNPENRPKEESHIIQESEEASDDHSGIIRDDEELYQMEVVPDDSMQSIPTIITPTSSNVTDVQKDRKIVESLDAFPYKSDSSEDFVPEILCLVDESIATSENRRLFRSLLDTGTSTSLLVENSLPDCLHKYCVPDPTGYKTWHTKAGTFKTSKMITLHFRLPQFHLHQPIVFSFKVDSTTTKLPTKYPFIMGRDLCFKLGLNFNFNSNPPTITCNNTSINMTLVQNPWTRGGRAEKEHHCFLLPEPHNTIHKNHLQLPMQQQISNLSIVRLFSNIATHLKTSKIIANFHDTNKTIEDANAALVSTQPT
jgi:hypothetical protein